MERFVRQLTTANCPVCGAPIEQVAEATEHEATDDVLWSLATPECMRDADHIGPEYKFPKGTVVRPRNTL